MYLMRIGERGHERAVARLNDSDYVDLAEAVGNFDEQLFAHDMAGTATLVQEKVGRGDVRRFESERIGARIARPHQSICVGLNCSDHAAGSGAAVASEPLIFSSSPDPVLGTYLRPGDVMTAGIESLGTQAQGAVRFDNEDGVQR